jgi:hypothetical protein
VKALQASEFNKPGEFAHGVCTRSATAGKRVEVSAVGEHNSPSPWTPVPRDQFKLHELTRDICQDGSLPSPMRECPWPDDDRHAEEEPSELPSPMRDCPRPNDDSHAEEELSELPRPVRDCPRPDDVAMLKRSPRSKLPSPPTRKTMKVA